MAKTVNLTPENEAELQAFLQKLTIMSKKAQTHENTLREILDLSWKPKEENDFFYRPRKCPMGDFLDNCSFKQIEDSRRQITYHLKEFSAAPNNPHYYFFLKEALEKLPKILKAIPVNGDAREMLKQELQQMDSKKHEKAFTELDALVSTLHQLQSEAPMARDLKERLMPKPPAPIMTEPMRQQIEKFLFVDLGASLKKIDKAKNAMEDLLKKTLGQEYHSEFWEKRGNMALHHHLGNFGLFNSIFNTRIELFGDTEMKIPAIELAQQPACWQNALEDIAYQKKGEDDYSVIDNKRRSSYETLGIGFKAFDELVQEYQPRFAPDDWQAMKSHLADLHQGYKEMGKYIDNAQRLYDIIIPKQDRAIV